MKFSPLSLVALALMSHPGVTNAYGLLGQADEVSPPTEPVTGSNRTDPTTDPDIVMSTTEGAFPTLPSGGSGGGDGFMTTTAEAAFPTLPGGGGSGGDEDDNPTDSPTLPSETESRDESDYSTEFESDDVYDYSLIVFDDYDAFNNPNADSIACMRVRNDKLRKNQWVILGSCEGFKAGWNFDDDGLLHSELDPDWCMQAGRTGLVRDGEYVRMRKCDPDKQLQKFVHIKGGGIRPFANQELCMVWRGNHADFGEDPMMFKKCDDVEDRIDWSGI